MEMTNGTRNPKGAQVEERLVFGGKMKDSDGYQIHQGRRLDSSLTATFSQ